MTTVLVTGAGGYIGSVLARMLLEEGRTVIAVDRFLFGPTLPMHERLRIVTEDVRHLEIGHLEGVDAVVDLAALSNDPAGELDPELTWQVNHRARVRVARLARAAGVRRYVFPSSCSIYGFQDGLLDETSPPNPLTTYAKANLQAESDILSFTGDRLCVTVLRQATVYGLSARMRFDLAINGMVRGLYLTGTIPVLQDGTQWRPFVHVRDTCRAMLLALEAPAEHIDGQIFNVGADEQNCQILPLARGVAEALGLPFQFEWYGLPDHRSYRVSFRKIHEVLGYQPTHSPADGATEVHEALRSKQVDPHDPRTITVGWYRHLAERGAFLKRLEGKEQA
ncbi:MAG: SDR family oxidoreductase [bacterium]|nr:SDR family oxidoreductase [bacterium]